MDSDEDGDGWLAVVAVASSGTERSAALAAG